MARQVFVIINILFIFTLGGPISYAAPLSCRQALSSTEHFIGYFSTLMNTKVIGEKEVAFLVSEITKNGKIPNVISQQNSDHIIHRENMQSLLDQENLNSTAILQWAANKLKKDQQTVREKKEKREKYKNAYIPMTFNKVKGGTFVIELRDFEVMSTPVTQYMWAKEMKSNPSLFPLDNKIELNIEGHLISLQPDYPVENITWYSAAKFANRLSKIHGLKEVYDFSSVTIKPGTNEENGTLDIVQGSGEVKITAPSIYETEGFRLPTAIEQEYLLSDRGRSKTEFFTGITEENIGDYAWYFSNSNMNTQEVATKLPLVIDGKLFFDLLGNVFEWSNDSCEILKDEERTDKGSAGIGHCYTGGCCSHGIQVFKSRALMKESTSPDQPSIGLRLVRTIK